MTTIRHAVAADAQALAVLAARTFRDTFADGSTAEDMALHLANAYGERQQRQELADPDITSLLVEVDGTLAGYAQVRSGATPACVTGDAPVELWRFYIDQAWHGRGLAQDLMKQVELEARARGSRTLWLGVWEHNARARAFYLKCGFTDVGSHVFMVGTDAQTDRILVRTLSRVTIHMAASLDGFIARKDGRVDWMETADEFAAGQAMDPAFVEAFLETIDCYVMGSRTYETALRFESQGFGWSYGDKPTFVLTSRDLPRSRPSVEFYSGDLAQFVNDQLRPRFRSIWIVGGGMVSAECLRLGLADEIRYSIMPILIGDGISFFEKLDRDVALHLAEVKAYRTGMVEMCYEVRKP